MVPSSTDSVHRVIGRNLAHIREDEGYTQERLAREMGTLGEGWTRSLVAAIETGRRALSNDEIVALAGVFGRPVGPFYSELIGKGLVRVSGHFVAEVANDGHVTIRAHAPAVMRPSETELEAARTVARRLLAQHKLRVRPEEVSFWARKRWLDGLLAERDRQVRILEQEPGAKGAPVSAIKIGHVTRRLMAELETFIRERKQKPRRKGK